jgi:hypothetical protein
MREIRIKGKKLQRKDGNNEKDKERRNIRTERRRKTKRREI